MNYIQFHLGDWVRSTQDLTPLERGVYFDLLQRYYQKERPLMQEECTRIARAYAPDAQEAMHYVLREFFTKEGDSYRHERCELEIAKYHETVEKRVNASKARWSKERAKKEEQKLATDTEACSTKCNASGYAHAEQVQSESSANGMLPNNQEPITNNQIVNNPLTPLQGELLSVEKPVEEKPKAKRQWQGLMTDRPEDITKDHWDQWIPIRKLKRLPVNDAVIEKMRREAEKAGLTLDQSVLKCIENGWAGFEARYLENQQQRKGGIERLGNSNPSDYLPNSKLKRQECRKYTPGI